MKQLKKNLAMYICMFIAVFCAMTLKAEAANVTTGKLGDNNGITWTYDADTKTLTITGEDSGLRRRPFEQICGDVETIKVENCTIKGRADSMFSSLESLKSVEFYNVDTTNVTDMSRMFSGCSNLERLDLSNLDTSNVTDMQYMFSGCSNLSSLSMSNKFNTGKVTNMYCMFKDCSKLSILDLRNFNTSNVIEMGYMFNGCKSLSSLDLSSFDTSKVTSMYSMFRSCSSLNNLDVSSFNTSNVTNMYFMFCSCHKLSRLDLSNFNTEKVTGMYQMFYYCSNLESLNVSSFNTSNVTTMTGMFMGCSKLNSLDVSSFDTSNVFSIDNMFQDCSSLSSLNLSNFDLSKIATSSPALWGCSNLVRLETPKTMPETLCISSSNTYANASNERTTCITADFCNTTLINVDYLISKIILNTSSITVHMGKNSQLTATISPEKAVNKTLIWKSSNTAVATVDASGKVTPVAPGTATITATATDYGKVSASCEVKVIYPVTGIVLSKTSTSLKVGGSETLTVTISPGNASDKAVTWKSSNTAVAKVNSSGKINAVGPGTATITATAKDGSGKSASCSVTVIQPVTGITLSKTDLRMNVGGGDTLTVTVSPANATDKRVNFTSSNPNVAVVELGNRVTAVGPGTATITATAADGSGVSATCSVTVVQWVSDVCLNKDTLSLKTGESEKLTVTILPEDATIKEVTWESSNTAVATVDANGKVTAVGRGTATITAITKDVTGARDSCEVTVTQLVTGITLNKTSASIKVGGTETLTVTVSPSNANNKAVTWKSSNTAVATVDANGKVTAVAVGTATISATAKDGSGKSASCSVTVIQPVTGITLNKTTMSLKTGATETLTVTVSPSNATNKAVTWKSSNTAVATVDSNGKVTAVGRGTATITATAKDGSGKSASCSVTVTQPVTGITLSKTSTSIKVGGTETLTVTVSPSNANNKTVTWKSSNTAVATVDANGKVTAVAVGTATITATAKDGSGKSASCSVTVIQPVTGITLNKTTINLKTGGTETLTVTVSPGNATNKAVTWKSSNTAVATVSSSGKITAKGPGTATITATAKDGSGKSASCSVKVTQPVTSVALNKTATTIHLGKSETLTVTVSPDNASNKAVTWKSSNTAVATVDSNGKVTAVAVGTATITATAKDGSGKSASCEVTVIRPVTEVILNKNSVELVTGENETLTATVKPDNASNKALTWKSSDTTVATVSSSGKVTAVAPGTATITATAKDGSGKRASCSVTVTEPMSEQERQVRAFVERMYTIVLGRAAEEQGLNDWTARLMAKEIDGATLVDMFVNSDEFINRNINDEEYIKILYRAVLGREADEGGLKMWKDMLADDWTRDYILEGLVLSTEFKNICDSYGIIAAFEPTAESRVRSFVKRMYTVVLNRRADAVGLNEWTQRLMNGTANGAQLADGFISSDEFVNRNLSNEKYVKVLYRAFFNREPDEGGFNVWMNELAKGTSRRDVMKGFVHSVEFSDLCAQYGIIRGEIQ